MKTNNYYAYIPSPCGQEPIGSNGKALFKCENNDSAIKIAQDLLGQRYILFSYEVFYKRKKYKLLMAAV